MRNDVPGGAEGRLVPLAGVEERAGGSRGRILIEQLRAQIRALEQVPVSLATPAPGAGPPRPACSNSSLNLNASFRGNPGSSNHRPADNEGQGLLDGRLCGHDDRKVFGKLKRGGLHEIKPEAYRDAPAALGFALAVIADQAERGKQRDLVLWCLTKDAAREWGRPYAPGLKELGLDPALLLIVEARNARDAAWALEEGLKSRALLAALAEFEIKAPLIARRLGLAAQASRTPCLLLSSHQGSGLPGTLTRWRIAPQRSSLAPFDAEAPGEAAWRLTLERARGSAPGGNFVVEFSHESNRFRLLPAFLDRAAEAGESEPGRNLSGQVGSG